MSLAEEDIEGQAVELKQAVTLAQDQDNEEEFQKEEKEDDDALNIGKAKERKGSKHKFSPLNVIIIGLVFFLVRIAMYKYFSIYSYFGTHAVETLVWAVLTGLAIGVVYEMTTGYICRKTWYLRFLIFGAVFLAVILIGFNGFMAGGICMLFDFKRNVSKASKETFQK